MCGSMSASHGRFVVLPRRANSLRVKSRGGSCGTASRCPAGSKRRLSELFAWEKEPSDDPFDSRPGIVEIDARWREMTDEELIERGLNEWLPPTEKDVDRLIEDYEP